MIELQFLFQLVAYLDTCVHICLSTYVPIRVHVYTWNSQMWKVLIHITIYHLITIYYVCFSIQHL